MTILMNEHSQQHAHSYRVIFFDLDGTLLPMELDEFMGSYFKRIGAYAAKNGLDAQLFMDALKSGTRAMAMSDDDRVNTDVFWDEFQRVYGADALALADIRSIADRFYAHDFGHIGDGFAPNPDSARAVSALAGKGYPLVLTTMPMFPLRAVQHRLQWAGVDPDVFCRITSYENSKTVKPRQTYYAENLAALGVAGSEVLMVGNNTVEDLAILDLGADVYVITDHLLDPVGFDLSTVRHSSLREFADWAETLPPCANPATVAEMASIPQSKMLQALNQNALVEIDPEALQAKAEALAQDIASH